MIVIKKSEELPSPDGYGPPNSFLLHNHITDLGEFDEKTLNRDYQRLVFNISALHEKGLVVGQSILESMKSQKERWKLLRKLKVASIINKLNYTFHDAVIVHTRFEPEVMDWVAENEIRDLVYSCRIKYAKDIVCDFGSKNRLMKIFYGSFSNGNIDIRLAEQNALEYFKISCSKLKLDLSKLKNVRDLVLFSNRHEIEWNNFEKIESLRTLHLRCLDEIEDLNFLSKNSHIQGLHLVGFNHVKNLNGLKKLKKLKYLVLDNFSELSDIQGLKDLDNLEYLHFYSKKRKLDINVFRVLKELPSLKRFAVLDYKCSNSKEWKKEFGLKFSSPRHLLIVSPDNSVNVDYDHSTMFVSLSG